MGRSGWAKLPFYSLSGERGGLYLRYGRADVSGLPCSASVFATLGFIEAAVVNPLQALPETSDQERAVARAVDLCRSFAEWKAAQQDAPGFRRGGGGARGGGGDDAALLAALEHAGFGLRLPPPARRSQALYALPLDIALPQGLLASLGAVESGSDRPHDFFDWLAAVGADAAASGRLRLFQLTHRGAAFCLLADGRDGRRPALHVFDPLGCTLHAANKRAYAVTFVASRRSGLEFNERPPAQQAEDFFCRRFRHTLKVDDAVAAAAAPPADAGDPDSNAGARAAARTSRQQAATAALRAAVRRHAVIEIQELLPSAARPQLNSSQPASLLAAQLALLSNPRMSLDGMYESMTGPGAPPSAPATARRGRLSSGSGSEPLSPRLSPLNPAEGAGGASPTKPPMAVQPWGRALNPRSSEGSRGSPSPPQPLRPALRRVSADATAAAAAVAAAPYSLPGGDAWRMPQRPRSRAGSVAGVLCSPRRPSPPSARRHLRSSSVCSEAGAISRGHSRRSSISSEISFRDVPENLWAQPTAAPGSSPTQPGTPRGTFGAASDLKLAAAALEQDFERQSRSEARHRRAASVCSQASNVELPETMFIRRDPARLRAAIAAAVGAPATVSPRLPGTGSGGSGSEGEGIAAAKTGAAAEPLARRPSLDAASTGSSARRSTQSDASGAASNAKSLASVGSRMSTDTAFGRAHSGNVKGKRTGGTRGADGKILGVLKDRSSGGKGGSKLPAIPSEPPSPRAKSGASPMMAGIKSMFRWMGRA